MGKYLIITKEKDYVSSSYKKITNTLKSKCMVYDTNGTLVYPHKLYDGEDRIWAKAFLMTHRNGDAVADAQEWYYKKNDNNVKRQVYKEI